MEMTNATAALTALGHASRLAVFRLLVEAGPDGRVAGEIAGALEMAPATLSFHLKELSAASLIAGEQAGRFVRYRARFDTMNALIEFLTHNCCGGMAMVECATAPARTAKRPPSRRASKG